MDFTELPKEGRCKFLLVLVDKMTHWVKAFPSSRAMTQAVSIFLLEEIIPRYGLVKYTDSDQNI